MSKLRLIFGTALLLAGCQSSQTSSGSSPPISTPTEEEISAANDNFLACLKNTVPRMDDNISDAHVIARAVVAGPCLSEAKSVVNAYAQGKSEDVRQSFSEKFLTELGPDIAIQLVLLGREDMRMTATTSPASEQEITVANDSFIDCIKDAVMRMDDGTSNPYTIGQAIVEGPCLSSAANLVEVSTRGSESDVDLKKVADYFHHEIAPAAAAQIVLIKRQKAK